MLNERVCEVCRHSKKIPWREVPGGSAFTLLIVGGKTQVVGCDPEGDAPYFCPYRLEHTVSQEEKS